MAKSGTEDKKMVQSKQPHKKHNLGLKCPQTIKDCIVSHPSCTDDRRHKVESSESGWTSYLEDWAVDGDVNEEVEESGDFSNSLASDASSGPARPSISSDNKHHESLKRMEMQHLKDTATSPFKQVSSSRNAGQREMQWIKKK